MKSFREVFPKKKVFLAVIHAQSYLQSLRNVTVAQENGADGVFLISHGVLGDTELIKIYRTLRDERRERSLPPFWMGLNCLGMGNEVFPSVPEDTKGIWLDNLGVRNSLSYQPEAQEVRRARRESGWEGLLFGGVAFKYQRQIRDSELAQVAMRAAYFADVLVTSGPATGVAPGVEKMRIIREGVGDFPLAIASGMTPENVWEYLPYANAFLVATGISSNFTALDPRKVGAFSQAVK